ncbi:MAG: hypothetical protein OES79_02965 [Planctomycetota bacterium]|nr:hypothetical protein [Planctomycetota bacterium]
MNDEHEGKQGSKRLSGGKLFALRLLICFVIVAGVYFVADLIFAFETHHWWLFAVMVPLGWIGSLFFSALIVSLVFYDRDD